MSNVFKKILLLLIVLAILGGAGYFGYYKWNYFNLLRSADYHFHMQKFQDALNVLSRLPDQEKISSSRQLEIEYMRAVSHQKLNNAARAAGYWSKIEKSPFASHKEEALYNLGVQLWNENKTEEAFEKFQKAAENTKSPVIGNCLFHIAEYYIKKDDLLKAREILERVVEKFPAPDIIEKAIDSLGSVNIRLLFSVRQLPGLTDVYIVQPGDSFATIAQKFNTTADFLLECNNKKTLTINPYDRIKVVTAAFSMVIDKSQNTLLLNANGKFFKRYHVGTGTNNSTPVGKFKIKDKLKNPTWFKPEGGVVPFGTEENALGTRWMSIDCPGYGIHGTWDRASIGSQSSNGCIRLLNEEVEELYKIVQVGTEVVIID